MNRGIGAGSGSKTSRTDSSKRQSALLEAASSGKKSTRNPHRRFTDCQRAATESTLKCARAPQKLTLHIETLMPGNQSFNQSLYAPLTHLPLVSWPAVHFKREGVYETKTDGTGEHIGRGGNPNNVAVMQLTFACAIRCSSGRYASRNGRPDK
jgi:hypothetical protein